MIYQLIISTVVTAQKSSKKIKSIGDNDFGKPAQIQYWFKGSFKKIEFDTKEALMAEKILMIYSCQNVCPYCKVITEKNFSNLTTKEFIQKNFCVHEIDIRGSWLTILSIGDVVDERTFLKLMKVQYKQPLELMNLDL